MTTPSTQEITRLLADWGGGDPEALEKLTPLVYAELRRIARRQMRDERPGHTLQATALVNEAFLRLGGEGAAFHDRAHFYAVCAQVMRHVLIDHARSRARDKRGGGARHVALEEAAVVLDGDSAGELVALDEALRGLEKVDPQKARVVELRYFAGLSIEETAEVLGVSPTTVRREWRRAKAWLYRAVAGVEAADEA
jgi:RNA polymerase sigma factor (TIGR02999 family)